MRECWKKQKQRKTMKMNGFGAATPLISWPAHLIKCKKLKKKMAIFTNTRKKYIFAVYLVEQ